MQAAIKSRLFSQLGKEINSYIKKGKIKDNFLDEEQKKQSLYDILKFIDESSPSDDRFKAMKTLFFDQGRTNFVTSVHANMQAVGKGRSFNFKSSV